MITTIVRKNVTRLCFKNSSSLHKSHVVSSLSVLHFSTSEAASQGASALTNTEKSDSVLSFLKESGFSEIQLNKMVKRRPDLLSSNLYKTIKPKIKILQESGLSAEDVAKIISNDPWVLQRSINNAIIPSLAQLKSLFGSNAGLVKCLTRCSWFLKNYLGLVPNVELLNNCGVSNEQIIWVMQAFPWFMLCKPEHMKKYVDKADEMGVRRGSMIFVQAVRVFSALSDETWELKVRTFREMGFSEDDILAMFRSCPMVFTVSEKKLKGIKQVLLANGKYNLSCMVNNPASFCYSVEKRYKPRMQVLEMLERKNLIRSWPCFSSLCKMTDKKFYEKFVGPHLDDAGDIFTAKSGLGGKGKMK